MTPKTRTVREFNREAGTWVSVVYESLQIPTADLKPGDKITAPGVGLWVPLRTVQHLPDGRTEVTYVYECGGLARQGVQYRRTAGKTTVHVRLGPDGGDR